jgi:glucosamine kinase
MLAIGLDVGGTKTTLLARSKEDKSPLSISGDGANLQRVGLQAASTTLATLVAEAIGKYPAETDIAICAGVAGAGRSSDQESLSAGIRELLEANHPDRSVRVLVVHDAAIALEAAFEGKSGIIVIAGTGSVGFGRTVDGNVERVGGWGYILGDEGSGNAIGVRGLRAVCAAFDGGPETALSEMVAEKFDFSSLDNVIHAVYRDQWPVQDMAPVVLQAARSGDAEAIRILEEQADRLSEQVSWLANRRNDIEQRIALIGGLSGADPYREILTSAIRTRLPGHDVKTEARPPVHGALSLAEKLGSK